MLFFTFGLMPGSHAARTRRQSGSNGFPFEGHATFREAYIPEVALSNKTTRSSHVQDPVFFLIIPSFHLSSSRCTLVYTYSQP